MAWRQKYKSRRFSRRKRVGSRRNRFIRKRFVRRVNSAVRAVAEKKTVLIYFVDATAVQAGTDALFPCLNGNIATGTTRETRIGNKIFGRYLKIRLAFSSNAVNNIIVRISLVRGRTAQGSLTVANTPTGSITQFWDIEKFHVVLDTFITLNGADDSGNTEFVWNRTFKIMKQMVFDDSTANTLITNPYFLYITSNDSVLPSPIVTARVLFTFNDY